MASKPCDDKSIGIVIEHPDDSDKMLIIERKQYPFGFSAPAGHQDEFPTPEATARGETEEEVGLTVKTLTLLLEKWYDNPCKRKKTTGHHWWVFSATVTGEIKPSPSETKQVIWLSKTEIAKRAKRTEQYRDGKISETDWQANPGIEPIWYDIFLDLRIIPAR